MLLAILSPFFLYCSDVLLSSLAFVQLAYVLSGFLPQYFLSCIEFALSFPKVSSFINFWSRSSIC